MGPVSTTFPEEEEDDGRPESPALTWVNRDVAGEDWDEGCCPRCGGCPGEAAATPAAEPRPRLDPADPEAPEEVGFMSTMALLAVAESPGGREGTALAVEMDALTFFWEESSVKE